MTSQLALYLFSGGWHKIPGEGPINFYSVLGSGKISQMPFPVLLLMRMCTHTHKHTCTRAHTCMYNVQHTHTLSFFARAAFLTWRFKMPWKSIIWMTLLTSEARGRKLFLWNQRRQHSMRLPGLHSQFPLPTRAIWHQWTPDPAWKPSDMATSHRVRALSLENRWVDFC